jgi:hypothetical protein
VALRAELLALRQAFAGLPATPPVTALRLLTASSEPDFLDFHYELLRVRGLEDGFHQQLRRAFAKRGAAAEDYLLGRLPREPDPEVQGDVLQLLGTLKHHGGQQLARTVAWARRLLASDAQTVSRRATWVLGWLGTAEDLELLAGRLAQAPAAEDRGWAATAMMQLCFSHPASGPRALHHLEQALRRERDLAALELVLISVQELSGKKLGLKASSRTPAPKAKVEAALRKALAP